MNFVKIKSVKVFSNGCLSLCHSNFIKFKLFTFMKKDLLALNKKKILCKKETKQLLTYTRKYLKL